MASTISITYKLQGNAKDLKALINDADGLKKAFNGAAVQAEQLPKRMGGLRSFTGSLTKSLGGMAAGLVSVGALVRGLSSAVNTMKEFESANSELASVLGKSISEIDGLTESAMELGRRTSFTAAEVTSLQTSLARLGFTEGQITINVTETSLGDTYNGKLQVWILEDSIVAMQTRHDPIDDDNVTINDKNYIHNHVLRDAVNGHWGQELSLDADKPKTQTYTYAIPSDGKWNPAHLSIVAFVYSDNGVEQATKTKINY